MIEINSRRLNSRFFIDNTHSSEDFHDLSHHGGVPRVETFGEEQHTVCVVHHRHQTVLRKMLDLTIIKLDRHDVLHLCRVC